jgi:hypothetical protein
VERADFLPPTAVMVNAAGAASANAINKNEMRVQFSKKVDTATAQDKNNYKVYPTLNPAQALTVEQVVLLGDERTVVITTSDQQSLEYTMEITNVKDKNGNVIVPNVSVTANTGGGSKLTGIIGSAATPTAVKPTTAKVVDVDNSGTVTAGDKIEITFDAVLATGTYPIANLVLYKNDNSAVTTETFGIGATIETKGYDKDDADYAKKLVVTLGTAPSFTLDDTKINVSTTTTIKSVNNVTVTPAAAHIVLEKLQTTPEISKVVIEDVNNDGKFNAGDKVTITY